MKKVLFVIPNFSHGGTNKSLENLLSLISDEGYDLSIYSLENEGVYRSVFSRYHIIEPTSLYNRLHYNFMAKVFAKLSKWLYLIYLDWLYKVEANFNKSLSGYDIIIAFQEGGPTYFTSYLRGDKIAWVHCDYNLFYNIGMRHLLMHEKRIYGKYKQIVCVADYTKGTFCGFFPELSDRVCRIYNALNESQIINASTMNVDDFKITNNDFVIVSIGRMTPVKQFAKIPEVVSKIVSSTTKKNLKWYIIGPESNYSEVVRGEISKYNMQEHIILMGGRNNPYPYIAKANLLISTSYSEACPYVVNEAKVLHIPVVSTDYPSAIELVSPSCGRITKLENMHLTILELINDNDGCYTNLQESCKRTLYSNKEIMDSFYEIIS